MDLSSLSFKLGEVWSYSSKSAGFVMPVIRENCEEREYITAWECEGKIKITDTGSIDKLSVKSESGKHVFIRSGSMFEGKGTQSRTLVFGVVIGPNSEETVSVRCIHASHGISQGRDFLLRQRSVTPFAHKKIVYYSRRGGGQSAVWDSVSEQVRECRIRGFDADLSDNMSKNIEKIDQMRADVDKDVLSKLPEVRDQVGMVVVDIDGVYSLEMFDHPDSFKAVKEDLAKKYRDIISSVQTKALFTPNMDEIKNNVMEFMGKIVMGKPTALHKNAFSETYSIESDVIGEYTTFKGKIIHAVAFRK